MNLEVWEPDRSDVPISNRLKGEIPCLSLRQPQEERTMPQTVTMQIEYRGGAKHLHLKQNTVLNFSRTGGQVTWNVEILPSSQAIPQATEVRVWFPLPALPFSGSPSALSFIQLSTVRMALAVPARC